MNGRRRLAITAALAALLLLACAGGDDTADQSLPTATPQALSDVEQEPRFEGELLGIFVGLGDVPERFITFDDVCTTPFSVEVPWGRAGELDLQLNLPAQYILQSDSINTGVIACEDNTVYVARTHYLLKCSESADVFIARSVFDADLFAVGASRVTVAVFSGREAILIEPRQDGRLRQPPGDPDRAGRQHFRTPFRRHLSGAVRNDGNSGVWHVS